MTSSYRGVRLDNDDWPFTSPPLTSVASFFEHHPACYAVDYLGPCNCDEIKSLWRKEREVADERR